MKNTITYKMRKLLALIALLLIGFKGFAQQDPMLSHYMFNGLFLNPRLCWFTQIFWNKFYSP